MRQTKIALFITSILLGNVSSLAFAEENTMQAGLVETEEALEEDQSTFLETIIVSDIPFTQQVGTQKITEEQIKNRPLRDGNITELLKNNPNIQFSNTADKSTAAGEIAPNEVSINGEKYYNNNYTIDGLSNNDNLNPAANNALTSGGNDVEGYSPTDLPSGGTQSFWIDTGLLKNVEVFDSNISAKYGRFTGGVINAELIDPRLDKSSGKIFYRTTRDSWASIHLQEGREESYNKAENLGDQPQFTKQQYGIHVSQPLSEKASILFSYNRSESKIPYHHLYLDQWDAQRRINESYLLKGIYLPDNGDLWKATLMYSPHRSEYFKKNIKNGGFTNTGGGFQVSLQWDKQFDWSKMLLTVAYKKSGNKVKHEEQNYYNYNNSNKRYDWCSNTTCSTSQFGGYGQFSTEKESLTFKQDFHFKAFSTSTIDHNLKAGWEYINAGAKYRRDSDSYLNIYNANDYLTSYTLYPARDVSANDNNYAVYFEDSMKWKNLSATIGGRFDRSEFLGNNNLAPRFSTSYDVFGNNSTQLFGGINRYYSGSVLTYKLRNLIGTRSICTDTKATGAYTCTSTTGTSYDVSDLRTPYSDEHVLGFSQKLYDTRLTFKWVNRHSKDQFVRTPLTIKNAEGVTTYYMTNLGRSKTDTFTLNITPEKAYQLKYATVNWSLGAQLSDSTSNYSTYISRETGYGYEKAIVNGTLKNISQLPTTDYNTPWSAFLTLDMNFPRLNLDWSQRFSYSAGYQGYTTSAGSCPNDYGACGTYEGDVLVYDEYQQGSYFMWDWHFAYKYPTYKDQFLEFTVDINNVLNRRIIAAASSGSNTYKMGRNFWLGASYSW
ncbi:TonB-dependent receptor [Chelonobacter oris]|uniref:TonB-dependent receptor n=1 Tax=Chelonobacter oris TaxID=505317 RepID=A0A0A3AU62_9PAST|nr:TonB-dependent receptor [Chelonobacter oris]KGQ70595.1 TonB-dependent receptor [Chelonobacter oris]